MSVALRRFRRSASAARASVAILASLVLITALAPAALAVPGLVVTTPFPAVRVEPGGTASFALTINTDVDRRVDLSVAGAPEGWKATFRGGGSIIDSVFVAANKSPDVSTTRPAHRSNGHRRSMPFSLPKTPAPGCTRGCAEKRRAPSPSAIEPPSTSPAPQSRR